MLRTDLAADLIAVHAGKHQIKQDQIRIVLIKSDHGFLAVIDDPGIETFLCEIQGNQFCDIIVIIYDENFLFCCHIIISSFLF